MRDEINARLDAIAERMGAEGASAEALNALHACRPGHPWNGPADRPFTSLAFMLVGRPLHGLSAEQRDWLNDRLAAERRASPGYPSPISISGGARVAWYAYADATRARKAAEIAKAEGDALTSRGHDFGFCAPGEIRGDEARGFEVCVP